MEGGIIMNTQIEKIAKVWLTVQNVFSVPHNDTDYKKLVSLLDGVIDEVGENENHPLASLMESLGLLVETYEENHVKEPEGNPIEILKVLMAEHGFKQTDLSEIGSQGVVSEILKEKRSLNIRQIKALSKKFHVSPAVFM
jgi:HTH-type transcriptional regulator/antitoxin HigA